METLVFFPRESVCGRLDSGTQWKPLRRALLTGRGLIAVESEQNGGGVMPGRLQWYGLQLLRCPPADGWVQMINVRDCDVNESSSLSKPV